MNMRLRYFTLLFLNVLLLLSVAGCTKKEEAEPKPTASYQINDQLVNCQVSTTHESNGGYDYLEIHLTSSPQPSSGPEVLKLYFYKLSGQPVAAYELADIVLYDSANPKGAPFDNDEAILTQAADGSFSGTFQGRRSVLVGFVNQKDYVLSAGVFSKARL
ncbi:hypothetical protein [Hymenobacter fodinae]|uniref:Uncharacterized protein n=1 Tax=Hymenobacter fodinae TaxID=2510796 RepID=A0A4Z0P5D1_9BACT|nr:hypothetical protein [Hymenobacter fodinae]TGE07612.1 hypothetical protein EU556_07605 [Hymenobacter fodinae]